MLVVEAGKDGKTIGTSVDANRHYDAEELKEGVIIWQARIAGDSTVVSCGNGLRCLEKEMGDFDIDLIRELFQVKQEMHITPSVERLLSDGSKAIIRAARELGYDMKMMLKFVAPSFYRKCGHCHGHPIIYLSLSL